MPAAKALGEDPADVLFAMLKVGPVTRKEAARLAHASRLAKLESEDDSDDDDSDE